MTLKGINHITFSVSNLENSIEFYKSVFDAKLLLKGEKLVYFDLCGLWLALNLEKDISRKEISESYTHISFSIEESDYEDFLNKLNYLGIKVLEGRVRHKDEGNSIYFQDPDGHKFEFHTGTRNERIRYYKNNRKDLEYFI